jgi:endonuclease/exonuclease/phosphatase family metal-dependent hydrolase
MTFNIRNGKAKDGENRWELRKDFVCDVIREYGPDVLGLQEAYRFQTDHILKRLPKFGEIGVGRDGGTKGEYSSILYLKDKLSVSESGTFWLSETPEKPSAHWGNSVRRVCTWARLVDKTSGRGFYVFNTHMDHRSQNSREKGAQLIMKRVGERRHPDPVVVMGDMNAAEGNPVVQYFAGKAKLEADNPLPLVDTWRVLHPNEKVVGTFSRFSGYAGGAKIDYVFVEPGTKVLGAEIDRTIKDGRNPSDHYPVTARLRFADRK